MKTDFFVKTLHKYTQNKTQGVAPLILFTYPVISFLRDWCKTPNDHWQPAMYADESGHEDSGVYCV